VSPSRIAVIGYTCFLDLLDAAGYQIPVHIMPLKHHDGCWIGLLLSDDGTFLTTSHNGCRKVDLYSGHAGVYIRSLEGRTALAFSPNCQFLAIESDNRQIHVWKVGDLKAQPQVIHHGGNVLNATFSAGGDYIVSAHDNEPDEQYMFNPPCSIKIML
jgi:WD40 repeat protein